MRIGAEGMATSGPRHRRVIPLHLGIVRPPSPGMRAAHFGDEQSDEPNYGAGDTGVDMAVALEQGGEDPFANVGQPGDPNPTPVADAYVNSIDLVDPWEPGAQVPTRRHPSLSFGGEHYAYFGPAAIIAGDFDSGYENGCNGQLGK